MENFLKKYNLPKLAKEIKNLNSLIFNKETEVIMKTSQRKPRPRWFHQGMLPRTSGKPQPHTGAPPQNRRKGRCSATSTGPPALRSKTSPELHAWLYFSPSQGAEILKKVNKSTPETCKKSDQACQADFLGRRRFYTRESNNSHLNSKRR